MTQPDPEHNAGAFLNFIMQPREGLNPEEVVKAQAAADELGRELSSQIEDIFRSVQDELGGA